MDFTEKTLEKKVMFEGRVLTVRQDTVSLPNGKTDIREIIEHNGGVCVAPITKDKELIFVRQYRYAYGEELLELPAGKLEKGENPLDAGMRELEEETGTVASRYIDMGQEYPSPGYSGEKIYLFAALDLKETQQHLDEGEFLSIEKISLEKAYQMVMSGEIKDSKTQILILKLKQIIKDMDE